MTFDELPSGASVFLDANIMVYHYTAHPLWGSPCQQLMERIGGRDIFGWSSTHALADVAHRVMTVEAMTEFGWAVAGMVRRLRDHPGEARKLRSARRVVQDVSRSAIHVVAVTPDLVVEATGISQETGLLTGDALIVAIMRDHGLTHLASHDADFDRVADLTRYAPA